MKWPDVRCEFHTRHIIHHHINITTACYIPIGTKSKISPVILRDKSDRICLPIGMHEMTAFNRETGEVLNTVNIYEKLGMGIDYVGGFNENAYQHHH